MNGVSWYAFHDRDENELTLIRIWWKFTEAFSSRYGNIWHRIQAWNRKATDELGLILHNRQDAISQLPSLSDLRELRRPLIADSIHIGSVLFCVDQHGDFVVDPIQKAHIAAEIGVV